MGLLWNGDSRVPAFFVVGDGIGLTFLLCTPFFPHMLHRGSYHFRASLCAILWERWCLDFGRCHGLDSPISCNNNTSRKGRLTKTL